MREIAEILDGLPGNAQPRDWDRVATTLLREARARIAQLEQTLDDLGSGRKLCDLDPIG